MIRETPKFITVVQVIREMGIQPTKELCWRVGDMMQGWYVRNIGSSPFKDLGPKTGGEGGSHCFAYYQPLFRHKIEEFVRMCRAESARQGELFGFKPEEPSPEEPLKEEPPPRPGVIIELEFEEEDPDQEGGQKEEGT